MNLSDGSVYQLNLYARHNGVNASFGTTVNGLIVFIGIIIYKSISSLTGYDAFWESEMRFPQVAEVMLLKRFYIQDNNQCYSRAAPKHP